MTGTPAGAGAFRFLPKASASFVKLDLLLRGFDSDILEETGVELNCVLFCEMVRSEKSELENFVTQDLTQDLQISFKFYVEISLSFLHSIFIQIVS